MHKITHFLTFTLLLATPAAVQADLLVDITDSSGGVTGTPAPANPEQTRGFSFNLTRPLEVTSLGIWDLGGNGLINPHPVGLWTSNGSLLADAIVPSGTGGTLVSSVDTGPLAGSGWRFTSLASPITLDPGDYVLGAFYENIGEVPTDSYVFRTSAIQSSPAATVGNERRFIGSPLTFPDESSEIGFGFFGPNLEGTVVPEPSSLLLVGTGMVGLMLRRRRTA